MPLALLKAVTGEFMIDRVCAICGRRLHTEVGYTWFCNRCYREYKNDIKAKQPWVQYVIANETYRRRWDTVRVGNKREKVKLVYLSNRYDIDEDGNLVFKEGHDG